MDRNTVERAVQTETDAKSRIKRSGQARLVYVKGHTPQPHRVKVNLRGLDLHVLLFDVRSIRYPVLPQWHIKDPGHLPKVHLAGYR